MIDSLVIFINQIPSTTQMKFFSGRVNSDLISGFLIEDQLILQALYAGGVDNWDGYDDAVGGEDDEDEEDEDS